MLWNTRRIRTRAQETTTRTTAVFRPMAMHTAWLWRMAWGATEAETWHPNARWTRCAHCSWKEAFPTISSPTPSAEPQNAILEQQALTQRFSTMKTTLVVLVVDNGWIHWAHIGDSRLYIFRGKRLLRRTLDHSVPQMLAQAGEIREADIRHHPDRNRLMRVMGVRNDAPRFEVGKPIRLTGAYQFLLCTDGYWELIEEDDMLRTLKESATPQQWLSQMNRIILENGRGQEMDNYTAIAAFETGRGLFGRKTH